MIRKFIFWLKWRNKIDNYKDSPISPELYGIAPNSFKITLENWNKLGL